MTFSNKTFWAGIKFNTGGGFRVDYLRDCGSEKGNRFWPSLWVTTPLFTFGGVCKKPLR
jgi:hypothetical protein